MRENQDDIQVRTSQNYVRNNKQAKHHEEHRPKYVYSSRCYRTTGFRMTCVTPGKIHCMILSLGSNFYQNRKFFYE